VSTITLTFTLPDERVDSIMATRAPDAFRVLREIDDNLRLLLKHGEIDRLTASKLAENTRADIRGILATVEET
jgi:hypothetical protein